MAEENSVIQASRHYHGVQTVEGRSKIKLWM